MAPTLRPRRNRVLPDKRERRNEAKAPKTKEKTIYKNKQHSKAQMVLNLSNWLKQAKAKEKNEKKIFKNGSGSAINTILSNIPGKSRSSVLRNQGKKGHEMGSPSKSNGRKQIILDNF